MDVPKTTEEVDAYLFAGGMTIDGYFMSDGAIGYTPSAGRGYWLMIDHEGLAATLKLRLRELGVRELSDI